MKGKHASTHKKVVVRKLNKDLVKGFINPTAFLGSSDVEMLDLDGHLQRISLDEIKAIYFVRDFEGNSERQERKVFLSRPKLTGLWVRMTFKDMELLDGIVSENLLNLAPQGFFITPPDVYSNNLKIFVPRAALASLEALSVISNNSRRIQPGASANRRYPKVSSLQMGLFPATDSPQAG